VTRVFAALVLAGSRGGPDPVADYAGVAHKALITLKGETLLARVTAALTGAGATRIVVSTSDVAVEAAATGEVLPATESPSLSVREAALKLGFPLLVTTCDHALLKPEWITRFLADIPPDADIAALVAPEALVRAAAAATQRSYIAFAEGRYSGCNLFYLANERALGVVDLWRKVEAHRKAPWRIAGLLGPTLLLGYLLRALTLDQVAARLGRMAGAEARCVRTPHGLAAIDVDKPADLDLVRALVEGGG
jgi:GTP:adenosylcobinamide-phosphate guanylyltransferase